MISFFALFLNGFSRVLGLKDSAETLGLKTVNCHLEGRVSSIQLALDILQGEYDALQAEYGFVQGELDNVSARHEKATHLVSTLKKELEHVKQRTQAVQSVDRTLVQAAEREAEAARDDLQIARIQYLTEIYDLEAKVKALESKGN